MDLSDFLATTSLIDCTGQVTHTLVLQIDGTVLVRFRNGGSAVVDPQSSTVLTPGVLVPEPVIAAARAFRVDH